jgi:3-deoxy-7-phosphoheptulonate synthase
MTPQTKPNTDDVRIKEIKELVPPAHVFREYPVSNRAAQTTYNARDDRLLVVVGPCSIHDPAAALDYARR